MGDRAALPADRLAFAEACLANWSVQGGLAPDEIVQAADRLWQWCEQSWPGASIEREVPVTGRRGSQRVGGRMDMLVRTKAGIMLIDHKTFPGGRDAWAEKVRAVAPQLAAYADVCGDAGAE